MYCPACGNQHSKDLSFCNRCGMNLKEQGKTNTSAISAFLTAITLIGVIGLGIMLGGSLALKKEANLDEQLVGVFMLFTFLTVVITEVLLVRQLSRLTAEPKTILLPEPQMTVQNELPPAQPRTLAEPIPSVTENTTRTLEYARREPLNR
jgi:uncharacterized protein (DUF983 family)